MPGTSVAIGRNSPRTSAGASGFMSHVSCCAGPPHMNSKMHALALPKEAGEMGVAVATTALWVIALASSSLGSESPSKPKPPARMSSRRDKDNAAFRSRQPVGCMRLAQGTSGW